MEYIDKSVGLRTEEEIEKVNGILDSLDKYGTDTSLYSMELIHQITDKEKYVLTKDGKLYNGAVKCLQTKQKDKLVSKDVKIVVHVDDNNTPKYFQFMVWFNDGTQIDARGYYARNSLKVVSNRGR